MSKPGSKKEPVKESYWEFVRRTADDVANWPSWKLGGTSSRDLTEEQPKKEQTVKKV